MPKVTVAVALYIHIMEWLRGKGYSVDGAHEVVRIESNEYWWHRWTNWSIPGTYCKAILFYTKGEEEKPWSLDVYGRKNMEQLNKLAEELATEFGVEIHVLLEGEKVKEIIFGGH